MKTLRSVSLLLSALAFLGAGLCAPRPAVSQTARNLIPVHFVQMVGPEKVYVGEVANFRARVNNYATRPVHVFWDWGDGMMSVGNLIAHWYEAPGTYTVRAVGRNVVGTDTAWTQIVVLPRPDSLSPDTPMVATASDTVSSGTVDAGSAGTVDAGSAGTAGGATSGERTRRRRARPTSFQRSALYGPGSVDVTAGGYTWVIRTYLWDERAREWALKYRLLGYRTGVYLDASGPGTPAHRVVIGQFDDPDDALTARAWLPDDVSSAWLLDLRPHEATDPEE